LCVAGLIVGAARLRADCAFADAGPFDTRHPLPPLTQPADSAAAVLTALLAVEALGLAALHFLSADLGGTAALLPAFGSGAGAQPLLAADDVHPLTRPAFLAATVIPALFAFTVGNTDADELLAALLLVPPALTAGSTALVVSAGLALALGLADLFFAYFVVVAERLFPALTAGSTAPIVAAFLFFAVGAGVAALASKTDLAGSAPDAILDRTPALMGKCGRARQAGIVGMYGARRHASIDHQAEELLDCVRTLTL